MVIGRIGGGLEDKDILTAYILQNLDEYLHIGKTAHGAFSQRNIEISGNRFRQRAVGIACNKFHVPFPSQRSDNTTTVEDIFIVLPLRYLRTFLLSYRFAI